MSINNTDPITSAEMERLWSITTPVFRDDVRRLITALRASREREKIAEESLTQLRDIVDAVEDDLGMDYINALIERS